VKRKTEARQSLAGKPRHALEVNDLLTVMTTAVRILFRAGGHLRFTFYGSRRPRG
jgi:hypothetical protein